MRSEAARRTVCSDRIPPEEIHLVETRRARQGGSAAQQYDSIVGSLLRVPERMLVYPGLDYTGWVVSTIGEERAHNPRLQVADKTGYIELMNGLNLPPPKMMKLALEANRVCGRSASAMQHGLLRAAS